MVVRVFVAGGSGALGRRLVPQLVARGHQVTATATGPAKLGLLEQLGADGVVMDGLDAVSVGEAVAAARPDAIVDQMTALSAAHAGRPDLKHPDRFFATTIRLRSEGTDHLLAAAQATGVPHVVAQGFGAFNGIREGGWVKTEELRPLLFAIAYRILGSVAEAEDAVQETWLRYESSPATPASAKAFLSAVVTRISIDVLRSARVRREEYAGPWLPEPLLTDPYQDPERSAELADSISMAALLLLERLSPLERAVFVLREVFGFGFGEIASTLGRSEAACRQLAVRARRHMDAGRPRFEADRRERDELAARFFDALREGDVEGLRGLLAADVQLVGDGGGKAPQLARSIIGAGNVARVLASIFPWLVRIEVTLEPREVNGQPGAIFRDRDGKVLYTLALDVLDGRIQAIRSVINPDKLGHVGPVADAWAVAREVNQARRPKD